MTKPQQPELARSGRSDVDPHSAKSRTGGPTTADPVAGAPVPEDNLPGHHPEREQDKPAVRPVAKPRGRRAAPAPAPAAAVDRSPIEEPRREPQRFDFAFDARMAPAALPFGITPFTTKVEVADGELRARFGPWTVRTPLDNVESAEVTGPYSWPKVIGPPRLSLRDRGVTFATNAERGVCIRFRKPVSALVPGGLLRHPGLTVTVDQPEKLAEALSH